MKKCFQKTAKVLLIIIMKKLVKKEFVLMQLLLKL